MMYISKHHVAHNQVHFLFVSLKIKERREGGRQERREEGREGVRVRGRDGGSIRGKKRKKGKFIVLVIMSDVLFSFL
jgi:hypothetical protein